MVVLSLVLACAVCGAAEQTLPERGVEVVFEGRRRVTLEGRGAGFRGESGVTVTELRAQAGLAIAVSRTVVVGGEVPVLSRSIGRASVQASQVVAGDAELRVTHTAWASSGGLPPGRGQPGRVSKRLAVGAGVKLPTAPTEIDPTGEDVPPDLQPGCASVAPMVSVVYALTGSIGVPVAAWATTSLLFPVSVRAAPHPGDSLRASVTAQIQPTRAVGARVALLGRLDGAGERRDGEVDRRSGGGAAHLSTEIVLAPVADVVLALGASFPVVQAMRGYRSTQPVLLASLGVDF